MVGLNIAKKARVTPCTRNGVFIFKTHGITSYSDISHLSIFIILEVLIAIYGTWNTHIVYNRSIST